MIRFGKKYVTARAIIVHNDKLLAFERKRQTAQGEWLEYYSIPGGELDAGESPESAVVRELREEMGITIEPIGRIAHYEDDDFEHYIFVATIVNGTPRFMADSEEARRYASATNRYKVVWVDIDNLTRDKLKFYGAFYEHIKAVRDGLSIETIRQIELA